MPLLRYFYIISFILVVSAFIAASSYARFYVENHIIGKMATDSNMSIGEGFTRGIWKKYQKTLSYLPCDMQESQECPDTSRLESDFNEFFTAVAPLKYTVHVEGGHKLFASDYSEHYGEKRLKDLEEAWKGNISNELILGYNIDGKKHNVIRTFFPIIPDTSSDTKKQRVPAVLELLYDITPFWNNVLYYQVTSTVIIILILVILFGSMYFATYKTENLLASQYEQNVDLVTAKASAEEASREKSKFLAGVSHELRTPLNAIIGFSEILKDEVMGPVANEQYKEYINDIHASGVHLLSLINDILDFSKAEAGKMKIEVAEVDITKLIKNTLRLIAPRASEAKVKLIEEIPDQHQIIKTDGKRLKQVILNLLSNAVKFTPEEGSVTLSAWHNLSDKCFYIEVRDTGVGIAPKDISKVMATFGQVENQLSRRFDGTGLGLPLSKKLVELMGGELRIKSEVGKGTDITIILPLKD